jgi:hypothetical protein
MTESLMVPGSSEEEREHALTFQVDAGTPGVGRAVITGLTSGQTTCLRDVLRSAFSDFFCWMVFPRMIRFPSTPNCAHLTLLASGLLLICGGGCGFSFPPWSADDAARGVRSVAEADGVKLTVEVMPNEARLSDELRLTLTVDHPLNTTIELPDLGDHVGDFRIRSFRDVGKSGETTVVVQGGDTGTRSADSSASVPSDATPVPRRQREYRLEPTRTGQLEIEPLVVTYRGPDAEEAADDKLLITESLSIAIHSPYTASDSSLDELADIVGPVELANSDRRWSRSTLLLMTTLVAVLAATIVLLWVARRRQQPATPPNPHEIALLELDRLWRTELHLRDVKEYYVRLTSIVRQFLERTTGLRAPERTTEEFLNEVHRDMRYRPERRERLGRFLESADLVKFAAYQPSEADIRSAWEQACNLVNPTESAEPSTASSIDGDRGGPAVSDGPVDEQ